jgi:GT2 family glycosyltransferase
VRASCGEYLLFSDADCIFPPDHLAIHLRARRPDLVLAGNCFRLTKQANDRIDLSAIASGAFQDFVSRSERRRLVRLWFKNQYYQLIRHPSKPKLNACDFGIWRRDFEAVNGFDEGFVGWGCEDDDLGKRLRRAGVRIETIVRHTRVYHLWHPLDPTHPREWRSGANVMRLLAPSRPIRCRRGLVHLSDRSDDRRSEPNIQVARFRIPRAAKVVPASRGYAEPSAAGLAE